MSSLFDEQKSIVFRSGENLPSASDYLWWIVNGVVKTYTKGDERKNLTLGFWGARDLVGNSLSNIHPYIAYCLDDVRAIAIPQADWTQLSSELLYCQQQTQQLLYIVRHSRIAQRLWLLLRWLADKFGVMIPQGKLINFKLTHQELADALGTTRITVTKTLNQFEQKGLILRPKTKCIIVIGS